MFYLFRRVGMSVSMLGLLQHANDQQSDYQANNAHSKRRRRYGWSARESSKKIKSTTCSAGYTHAIPPIPFYQPPKQSARRPHNLKTLCRKYLTQERSTRVHTVYS
ncbi:hypothetical protein G7K_5887-t1 [Saitoella complicata NRRL Y-17804]|uniref:Uncharacterized protein n=1 Tax=Saitoella complicata (strain BCRC 22490 / CBS 7301 / JCM 7358 / NBRC 10748 / NRRL Y-17804) TaxID=698492 RepID=A0A0E9NQ22_SAICN|nr:hypothetical protein G7K_5887-t1 [Saitoella complicata NRRL Y-17804]